MTSAQSIVTLLGVLAIVWVNYYFFCRPSLRGDRDLGRDATVRNSLNRTVS